MTTAAQTDNGRDARGLRPIPRFIFASRWLQLPLYLGLIVAQVVYVYLFLKELLHLVMTSTSVTEQGAMLIVLGLIDVVMISNLLIMVIVGGYETFVSRMELNRHPDQPEWLSHVNASVLKIKLAMAIIGISSIHLLRTFIEAGALGTASRPIPRPASCGRRSSTACSSSRPWALPSSTGFRSRPARRPRAGTTKASFHLAVPSPLGARGEVRGLRKLVPPSPNLSPSGRGA